MCVKQPVKFEYRLGLGCGVTPAGSCRSLSKASTSSPGHTSAAQMQNYTKQHIIADAENTSRMQDNEAKPVSADKPSAGVKAATSPDRLPMIQLSPNAAYRPAKSPLQVKSQTRIPEVATPTFMTSRFGGSTTHREGSHTSPGMWQPASSSGSMTARGELRMPAFCTSDVGLPGCLSRLLFTCV